MEDVDLVTKKNIESQILISCTEVLSTQGVRHLHTKYFECKVYVMYIPSTLNARCTSFTY